MSRGEHDQPVLEALLQASHTLYAARVDRDGLVLEANPALERAAGGTLVGERFDAVVAAPQRPALAAHLGGAPTDRWACKTIGFWQGGSTAAEDRLVHVRAVGSEVVVVAEPHGNERDRLVEQVLQLNDDLIASQRDLGRRQREVSRAQAGAEEAGRRLRRLEAITLAGFTASSLDVALERMLVLAREALGGERAAVLLLDDDDRRRLRVRAALGMDGILGDYARMGTGVSGLIAATGRGMVFDDMSLVDGLATEHQRFTGSLAGVPLRLDGEVIGTLHVSTSEVGRFGDDDLRLLEAVGDRAALAIGHAQLRERERDLAETLQRSLLPRVLPAAAGVRLAARYLPRGAEGPVGGDFYDAVALPGDRVGLAIGDVAGKGLSAAAAMGQVRAALHAYALEDHDPARVLARLDRFVAAMDITATALFVTIDAAGELAIASAGHPPAVLADASGTRLVTGVLTPPLGCAVPAAETSERLRLGHGARLLLYTDGLVERRDERLDRSLEALRVVVDSAPAALDALCDRVLEALAPDGAVWPDDVALLAVARD